MLKTDITRWIGKQQSHDGRLGDDIAAMLHTTLRDDELPSPRTGDVVPPLWHWAAFTQKLPMSQIADDGHPHRGDFLPPVALPRRMWAGGRVDFHAPLHIGTALRQTSTIRDVVEKSDTMVFVTVHHEIHQDSQLCLSEDHNIVYLEIPDRFSPPAPRPVPASADFVHAAPLSALRLFRYSAATFNGHRIHYDLDYAREVEKYPGLVVHGPLQATLMLQAAMSHAGRSPATFTYRGVHPIFHTDDLHIFGQETATGMTVCTGIPEAHQGMQATVTWKES
ncbi:MaoC family dehydratase N-terminal domain-containing protein [Yoonia sp. SS1-5]|uniref:MaoC family dehydratase N-terminal domain-containing protein n=1 Tax=Yoonia rhodophyticola TaxID=3137370 RepID=A0AAN0MBW6_9RHOB